MLFWCWIRGLDSLSYGLGQGCAQILPATRCCSLQQQLRSDPLPLALLCAAPPRCPDQVITFPGDAQFLPFIPPRIHADHLFVVSLAVLELGSVRLSLFFAASLKKPQTFSAALQECSLVASPCAPAHAALSPLPGDKRACREWEGFHGQHEPLLIPLQEQDQGSDNGFVLKEEEEGKWK